MCQVRPLGWLTVIVVLILLRKKNFCTQENNFHNSQKCAFDLILSALQWYTNFPGYPDFLEFLELQKYLRVTYYYRVFCFWQILFSMCSMLILMNLWVVSGGYEPWKSWNTVDIIPIWIKNEFTTVPKVVIYFIVLTELMRFSVEFCVVELSSFG